MLGKYLQNPQKNMKVTINNGRFSFPGTRDLDQPWQVQTREFNLARTQTVYIRNGTAENLMPSLNCNIKYMQS